MISYFPNVYATESTKNISIEDFYHYIRAGKWVNDVIDYRKIKATTDNSDTIKKAKYKLPSVTISGTFSIAKDSNIQKHSGYICIDIDDVEDPEALKDTLSGDEYVAAAFISCGGSGLALVFSIDGKFHKEAYLAISKYLYEEYECVTDPSCKNVARKRFVSYDENIFVADHYTKWHKYDKPTKKINRVVYTGSDFSEILNRIQSNMIDITGDYHQWLSICFGIANHFGEAGRSYFHTISQFSNSYDYAKADKQYNYCLRDRGKSGSPAGIGSVYYYAKLAGIETVSAKTKQISRQAAAHKKSGLSKEEAKDTVRSFGEFTEDIDRIYDQVFDTDVKIDINEDMISSIAEYLNSNFNIQFNDITRRLEIDGRNIDDMEGNSLFLKCKNVFEKLSRQMFDTIILSDHTKRYNPLQDWFKDNEDDNVSDEVINQFFECINTGDTTDQDYVKYFGKKWLVSIVSAAYGEHSPLMLVLSGQVQGTGKTYFFRNFLPAELKKYYAESKLDAGKDDEILMTQKLVIMDDEMGGKSKRETKRLKELTSKDVFTLRAPYGRYNEDLKRLAVLCGTSNHNDILQDPTGNRRIIPINVSSINQTKYNQIDKKELMQAAYNLYKANFDWRILQGDIELLRSRTKQFEAVNMESELIMHYLTPDVQGSEMWISTANIIAFVHRRTNQRLSAVKVGMVMKDLGFESQRRNLGSGSGTYYKTFARTNDAREAFGVFDSTDEGGSIDLNLDVPF